ncbi:MAG: hypothetical protein KDC61_24055, partial [Saprospiraceae bacterium]|nr:hypothetical protein [Saprospiraceae bacterium]
MTKEEFFEEFKDCAGREVLEEIWEVKQEGGTQLNIPADEITDLRVLSTLTNLTDLDLSATEVVDLSPLSMLTNLTELYVYQTQIEDLSSLSTLTNLEILHVDDTSVSDLGPLLTLTNLTELDISNTLVRDLSPIIPLIEKGLQVKWSSFNSIDSIFIEGCPLIHPPVEIAKLGNEAILRYFRERERSGTIKLMEARLLLVGQGASGKTTLRRKLLDVDADMPEKGDTTRGIEVEPLEFKTPEGDDFTLQIWDFGGQNIQHYAHQFFLSDSSVYALLSNEREQ